MSRLWPDALEAGLFPGDCWLARGKRKREVLAAVTDSMPSSALLDGFGQCLTQAEGKWKGRAQLSIVVSDSIAAIAPLPWQDGLNSAAEWQGYARLCFERLGYDIGTDWAMHVEYPRYGAAGLAYALPRPWMRSLLAKAEEKRMRVRRVLPVSAQAFCGIETARSGLTIVLLFEATQHGALVLENGVLLAREVEPHTQSVVTTCRRLLARILATRKAGVGQPVHISWWAYKELSFPDDVVKALAIDAKVTQIADGAWA